MRDCVRACGGRVTRATVHRVCPQSEAGISFTEFTYQLLQGYDFVKLHRDHGVDVQVGGSDQWGNITAGTELLRKMSGDGAEANAGADGEGAAPSVFGLTFPLLLDASGNKFGKSTGGAIWLSPDKLSPYQFYQYLFKTEDADVVKARGWPAGWATDCDALVHRASSPIWPAPNG